MAAMLSMIHLAFCGGKLSCALAFVMISFLKRYFGADLSKPSGWAKLKGIVMMGKLREVSRSVLLHSIQPKACRSLLIIEVALGVLFFF